MGFSKGREAVLPKPQPLRTRWLVALVDATHGGLAKGRLAERHVRFAAPLQRPLETRHRHQHHLLYQRSVLRWWGRGSRVGGAARTRLACSVLSHHVHLCRPLPTPLLPFQPFAQPLLTLTFAHVGRMPSASTKRTSCCTSSRRMLSLRMATSATACEAGARWAECAARDMGSLWQARERLHRVLCDLARMRPRLTFRLSRSATRLLSTARSTPLPTAPCRRRCRRNPRWRPSAARRRRRRPGRPACA